MLVWSLPRCFTLQWNWAVSPLGLLISRGSDTINGDTAGLFVVRGMSVNRKISLTMSDTDWAYNIYLQLCIDLMTLEIFLKSVLFFLFFLLINWISIIFLVLLHLIQSVSWKYRGKLLIIDEIIYLVRFKFFLFDYVSREFLRHFSNVYLKYLDRKIHIEEDLFDQRISKTLDWFLVFI